MRSRVSYGKGNALPRHRRLLKRLSSNGNHQAANFSPTVVNSLSGALATDW